MNEIVSFTKEIEFNSMVDKITSISIEHTLISDNDYNVKGDLIVSGTYKETTASQIDTPFSYRVPVDMVIDSKYDISNITIDIDDFTYNLDDNKLIINVSLILDNLKLKEEDEIIKLDDLFLEKENNVSFDIPMQDMNKNNESKETINDNCNESEKKDNNNENEKENDNINLSDSLFSKLDSVNETYKAYNVYILRDEDTLDEVISKYKVSREILEEYNDLNNIKTGTKIIIPYNE